MTAHDVKQVIKDTVDIADFISQYTSLTPSGNRMKGLSPFTNEKTPSFFVNPDEGLYYCFSSQKGGDIFSFVQEAEGVDFKNALKIVAEYAGIELTQHQSAAQDTKTPLYHALEAAQSVYLKNIPAEVKQYLRSRGITEETANAWGIGYAPDAWNTICDKKMPNCQEYIESGLCVRKDDSVYDRFRGRILFPFYDVRGKIIGFSGRAFGDETGAKYINSPETPLFKKSEFLYGLHRAKSAIRKNNVAMLVEGPIDAIMAHQAGYEFTVATSGTAVTAEHLRQIQRLTRRLIIALDSDAAGVRAALRVIAMCLSFGTDIKIVSLPGNDDPADVLLKDPDVFKTGVKNALAAFEYLFSRVHAEYGEKSEDVVRGVREKIIPMILVIRDPLMRETAVRETAAFCSLGERVITESMEEYRASVKHTRQQPTHRQEDMRVGERTETGIPLKKAAAPDNKKTAEEKIRQLFFSVGSGKVYLTEHAVPIRPETEELFREIASMEAVPAVERKVVKMRYEIDFPDEKTRSEKVLTQFSDAVTLLRAELLKRQEREKMNETP